MSNLRKKYREEVVPSLIKKFNFKNKMMVPSVKKIVINVAMGESAKDKNKMQATKEELSLITGQIPVEVKAKKSVSNFKTRKGQTLGYKVTLRGTRMYDFLDRFCNLTCPRIKDFRGFKLGFDGRGSFSVGLEDQRAFLEINHDKIVEEQGMIISIVTSAKTDEQSFELLKGLGIPFKKDDKARGVN